MSLHFRPLLNWLFPPFKPLELALIEKLKASLNPVAAAILENRIASINLVQRNFNESNLYSIRRGRVCLCEEEQFPLETEEARFATIKFKVPESERTFSTTFWLVKGFLFSMETSPDPRAIQKATNIQIESVLIHCDPMQRLQEGEEGPDVYAYIALGSNLGDSSQILREAMSCIEGLSWKSLRRSSLWQSSPVDCPPGSPMFLNAVVALTPRPGETPESLLLKLQALEREFGRKPKKILNEARALDLDLIAFGKEMRATPELTLPHPRAHLRRFVLAPLSEIAPDLILPGQTESVIKLLKGLTSDEIVRVLG